MQTGITYPSLPSFALGYEHSVVNMFLIPAGIWMGTHVTYRDWWLWNQIPVTLGNLVGGILFVGIPMLWMSPSRTQAAAIESIPEVELQEA